MYQVKYFILTLEVTTVTIPILQTGNGGLCALPYASPGKQWSSDSDLLISAFTFIAVEC